MTTLPIRNNKPAIGHWTAVPELALTGTLPNGETGSAYSGSLNIENAMGVCTVALIAGELPPGYSVSVDPEGLHVIVAWPAFAQQGITVPGGDFEDESAWTYGPGWTWNTGYDHLSGDHSAAFANFRGDSVCSNNTLCEMPPNTPIKAALQVQQGASSAGNVRATCGLVFYDANRTHLSTQWGSTVSSGSDGEWQASIISTVSPATAAFVQAAFFGNRKRQNSPLYVDDFTWDLVGGTVGSDVDSTFCIALEITDEVGRKAQWSGCISTSQTSSSLSDWRWLNTSLTDTTDYSPASFDDSSWSTGQAPFGNLTQNASIGVSANAYDSRLSATINQQVPLNTRTWIRRTLTLSVLPNYGYDMIGYFDNSFTIWVNGVQVASNSTTTNAGTTVFIPASAFVVGQNIIACRCDDEAAQTPPNTINGSYFDFLLSSIGTVELAPTAMQFSALKTISAFDLQPAGAQDFSNSFSDMSAFSTVSAAAGPVSAVAASGVCTVSQSVVSSGTMFVQGQPPTAPLAIVSIDVQQVPTYTSGKTGALYVLMANPSSWFTNSSFGLVYNSNNQYISLLNAVNGTATYSPGYHFTGTGPFRLGFAFQYGTMVSLLDTGSGWTVLESMAVSAAITLPATLATFNPAFVVTAGTAPNTTQPWKFTNFQSGAPGCARIRDVALVYNPDGTPYTDANNAMYLTGTAYFPSLGTAMRVFRYDPVALTLTQTGIVSTYRGGKFWNDTAGTLIRNSATSYDLYNATWGNGMAAGGTIQIQWGNIAYDVLNTNRNVLSNPVQPALPGVVAPNGGCYDPCVWFDGTTYTMAYTVVDNTNFTGSPFWPALATSSDRVNWTLVGSDNSRKGYEGTTLYKTNSDVWLLNGGPSVQQVYNSSCVYQGVLTGAISGGGNTQPWATLYRRGGYVYKLTFDGTSYNSATFSWGNLIIQQAPRWAPDPH